MSKFKNILKDILYVSRISKTENKKLLILTSVILTQVAAYTDIGIIVIFSALMFKVGDWFSPVNKVLYAFAT